MRVPRARAAKQSPRQEVEEDPAAVSRSGLGPPRKPARGGAEGEARKSDVTCLAPFYPFFTVFSFFIVWLQHAEQQQQQCASNLPCCPPVRASPASHKMHQPAEFPYSFRTWLACGPPPEAWDTECALLCHGGGVLPMARGGTNAKELEPFRCSRRANSCNFPVVT